MRDYDLELLKARLAEIKDMGWIKNRRPGNAGGVGNTLEDLLGVKENNLQLPDFGAWEIKTHRARSSSLLTLFHIEPNPRKAKIVKQVLLKNYSWPHKDAGTKYPADEKTFHQTINTAARSDRGFCVKIDYNKQIIYISFDFSAIDTNQHAAWQQSVAERAGIGDISPTPYWTFDDIERKLKKKLNNMFYISAQSKWIDGEEYFRYDSIEAFIDPTLDNFLSLTEQGAIYADFDARTGHNHGTKFRIWPARKKELYQTHIVI